MIGEKLNQYTFKSILGEGGMAIVYLAYDNNFRREVAIKLLKRQFVYNDNIRKRFLAEARNMHKMSHLNVVKVLDLIDAGDIVAFVMEFIEGETLKQKIDREGPISMAQLNHIYPQMLDGVGYVHEQGIIHRDIKPSNFMITKGGIVKLTDFGIAKSSDQDASEYTMTGTAQQMGTPLYMSPEQVKSTRDVTKQTDIYSLGVVLWYMVTGRKPYNEKTLSFFELMNKIVNEKLPAASHFNPSLSPNLNAIITKATEKEPNKRFQSCAEFLKVFNRPETFTKKEKEGASKKITVKKIDVPETKFSFINPTNGILLLAVLSIFSSIYSFTLARTCHILILSTLLSILANIQSARFERKIRIDAELERFAQPFKWVRSFSFASLGVAIFAFFMCSSDISFASMKGEDSKSIEINGINNGSFDIDRDGFPDEIDKCPHLYGKQDGCPDKDYDGVLDNEDLCPEVKGLRLAKGCPDRDNDGVIDKNDNCPDEVGSPANNGCPIEVVVGEEYQGGLVYYIDDSGRHGLICAKNDLGKYDFKDAIRVCSDAVIDGYSDWRLPDIDELKLMYNARKSLRNFDREVYRSLTSQDDHFAWGINFGTGESLGYLKWPKMNVRPIRSF